MRRRVPGTLGTTATQLVADAFGNATLRIVGSDCSTQPQPSLALSRSSGSVPEPSPDGSVCVLVDEDDPQAVTANAMIPALMTLLNGMHLPRIHAISSPDFRRCADCSSRRVSGRAGHFIVLVPAIRSPRGSSEIGRAHV